MTPLSQRLLPLLLNEKTNEPYLRLPFPHSNIIITPPRQTDADRSVELLNDRQIIDWLEGPPYPYHIDHARQWIEVTDNRAQKVLDELKTKPVGEFVGGCPVRCLREVKHDGEEVFLGDCGIVEWGYNDVDDIEERKRLTKENLERPPGHPDKEWVFGDYLATSHHNRGIMSLVVKTLMEQWVVPRMGAKKINAAILKGNIGSVRVFEKIGFYAEKTIENYKVRSESKGGGIIGLQILRWQLAGSGTRT
ncbi:GNAT domain-containing protein [Hysterangium stoloniferum]|nr:GNAT domain-containing protein [Hysterangium stoloniferum]